MFHARLRIAIVTATIASMLAGPTADCQAGLFDWLFPRRRRQTTLYAPVATPACNTGCNTCYAPPVMPVMQRVLVSYQPQTVYRPDWRRVPVTYYRPVATTDPCTGCPVSTMRPCTSYQWQQSRVPVTTYRPVYQTVVYDPCANTAAQPVSAVTSGQPVVSGGDACGCSSGVATPAVSAPPYYQGPSTPILTTPSVTQPPPATTVPGAQTPADTRPSLDAGTLQPLNPQSSLRYPIDASSQPPASTYPFRSNTNQSVLLSRPEIRRNDATTRSNDYDRVRTQAAPPTSSSPRRPSFDYGQVRTQPVPARNQVPGSDFDMRPLSSARPMPPTSSPGVKLNPIPDPSFNMENKHFEDNQFPQLLNPRDKTARTTHSRDGRQRAWAYTKITWPKSSSAAASTKRLVPPPLPSKPVEPPTFTKPVLPVNRPVKWDASGWYTP